MKISAIIPAHNEEKYLGACLESLLTHRPPNLSEIIVVDNASTDSTAKLAAQFHGVTVISEPRKGPSHARQRGLQVAQGTHLAFLDADTRVHGEWFGHILRKFDAHPGLVALSGPYDYDDLPPWQRRLVRTYWRALAAPAAKLTGYVIVGGNFVVRRDALERIGGFDTSIAFYGDDTNIARRLHAIGMVHFDHKFFAYSSGRRITEEGLFRTAGTYMKNYLSEVFWKKPFTKTYTDVR